MVTREDRAREAKRLRKSYGFIYAEIVRLMGISRSYANALVTDPDGSKQEARRETYRGTCVDCGARTTGSEGREKAPKRCAACSQAKQSAEKYWTEERIIAAIQRYAAEHGRPPVATEWLYGSHGINVDGYPYASQVLREMGSWGDAIEAAGFPRPEIGRYVRTEEWRKAQSERKSKPLEVYIERIRATAVDGLALPAHDPRMAGTYERIRLRGITWAEACAMAGVKPRGRGYRPPTTPEAKVETERPSLLRWLFGRSR